MLLRKGETSSLKLFPSIKGSRLRGPKRAIECVFTAPSVAAVGRRLRQILINRRKRAHPMAACALREGRESMLSTQEKKIVDTNARGAFLARARKRQTGTGLGKEVGSQA